MCDNKNPGEVITRCENENPRNEVESPRDRQTNLQKGFKSLPMEAPLVDKNRSRVLNESSKQESPLVDQIDRERRIVQRLSNMIADDYRVSSFMK